ncbi:MAG: hypothetical protein DRI69_01945 [Bacteroidetes bacterium]|nr:MAG: hypothetical protein DRI69_01945 [Bacteroidota bacterium]
MKSILFSIIALVAVVSLTSCGADNDSDVRRDARESLNVESSTATPTSPSTSLPPANSTAQATTPNTSGVDHYTCPNNCEGSGGSTQVACPVCGTQYVHNQAFHASQTSTPPATPNVPATPPAAQNAAGVYHYTCPSGCEGGAAGAGSCATCGSTLAHNTAFHNN